MSGSADHDPSVARAIRLERNWATICIVIVAALILVTAYAGIHRPGGEGEMGGLNPERPAGPGLPLVVLYSDDLDATLESVRAAGAEITEEPFEFPGGRRFHFTDPFGNELAVWTEA